MVDQAVRKVNRLAVVFLAALAFGAVAAVASPPVSATNWSGATGATGCMGGVNKADSAAHGFYYVGLTAIDVSAMNWARTNVIDPTDVNTFNDVNSPTTDVMVHDGAYTNLCGYTWLTASQGGLIGLVECVSLAGGNTCEQFRLYLNQYYTDNWTAADAQGLSSHEVGHTLGLLHRASGNTSMRPSAPFPSRYYDAHDVGHLNLYY